MNPTPGSERSTREALQASEVRYRRLFEAAQDGILILDGQTGQITDANPFLLDMLGYTREQLLGKELWQIGFFKDRTLSAAAFEKLHQAGYIRYECLPLKAKDGRGHEVEFVSNAYEVDHQRVIQCNVREITERQQAARDLFESRERLQRVIHNIPQYVFWKDRDLNYLGANALFARSAGLREPEEIIGKSDFELSWKQSAESYRAVDRAVIETGVPRLNYEEAQKRPDGSVRWLRTSKVPLLDNAGKIMGILGIYEDITQHKDAEDAHRQSEANLANAQRIAHLGSWEWRIIENKLHRSAEACRIVGLPAETSGGTYEGFLNTVHPADRAAVEKALQESLAQKGPYTSEHRVVRPDGSEREVREQGEVFCDDTGRPIRMVGTTLDITERKALEAQFLQAQKMEAVGQLAGGVAHDYNNILTSTLLQLSLLLNDQSLPENAKISLRQLENEARRAAGLTRQLLLFSRQPVIEIKPLNLNAVLANLIKMLQRLLSKDIRLEFQSGDDPLWIEADPGMIEQVVINLCVNARDAMAPKGGRLTIDARLVKLDAEAPRVNPEACRGSFVCLSVADTGCGMDAETLKRSFEPFFTTKALGKGTGLGLATVYRITKKHRGWVEVASQLGKGTTFRIYFPALANAPLVRPESRPSLQVEMGTETILLVDDDIAVRDMTALGLKLLGYHVLEATSGQEAIQVWDDHAGEIHLLFTDMRMPGGLTGMDLFERFKRTKATLKGIISSGYSDEIVKAYGLVDPGITFLPKPFDVKALARTVRNCLDQPDPLRVSEPTS